MLLCVFSLLLAMPLPAEEMLARVQRELRARKYYFGEVHGKATEETSAAIGKFQEARGLERTGNLDDDTLKALGLPFVVGDRETTQRLTDCCTCVQEYYRAWESGDWKKEEPHFAGKVYYFDDREVTRDFIRKVREEENQRWPQRKAIVLQRIASRLPSGDDTVQRMQVTARVRTEVAAPSKEPKANTEDLIFWLEKRDAGWCIYAVKVLE